MNSIRNEMCVRVLERNNQRVQMNCQALLTQEQLLIVHEISVIMGEPVCIALALQQCNRNTHAPQYLLDLETCCVFAAHVK